MIFDISTPPAGTILFPGGAGLNAESAARALDAEQGWNYEVITAREEDLALP